MARVSREELSNGKSIGLTFGEIRAATHREWRGKTLAVWPEGSLTHPSSRYLEKYPVSLISRPSRSRGADGAAGDLGGREGGSKEVTG
ncbi:hypothetical protein E2C01_069938 [Portunus trituberculatus]|uniref:Uncharacterized protein n=1 Tax=Portunus trituberculatus TaxID=210409 RepID=A0A5B7I3T3_PORTR|nr:hypothetical protein [Portunus trituberculatus]